MGTNVLVLVSITNVLIIFFFYPKKRKRYSVHDSFKMINTVPPKLNGSVLLYFTTIVLHYYFKKCQITKRLLSVLFRVWCSRLIYI